MPAAEISSALAVGQALSRALLPLPLPAPAAYAYHPLDYAREGWRAYLLRYGGGGKEVLFVGMNPGPFGMAQTGVPFGAVSVVRQWMALTPRIGSPQRIHPRRPVWGLDCPREEVSGRRLWGWAARLFGSPAAFFSTAMVVNFCPVMWCDAGGRNVTPEALPAAAWRQVAAPCRAALAAWVAIWRPRAVVGIGALAAREVALALPRFAGTVGRLLHPSPASPAANRGWEAQASATMAELLGPRWRLPAPAAGSCR